MDIDQEGTPLQDSEDRNRQILLPSEVHPNIIHILPQEQRPYFPGQAIPLVMDAATWLPTLESVQTHNQNVVGLIATKRPTEGLPTEADLFEVGCLSRIHRVHHEGEQLQVILEGLERFEVREWIKSAPPLTANVRYFPERRAEQSDEEKAYAVAIINIIKELIPLNPLFGEELKVFLDAVRQIHQ